MIVTLATCLVAMVSLHRRALQLQCGGKFPPENVQLQWYLSIGGHCNRQPCRFPDVDWNSRLPSHNWGNTKHLEPFKTALNNLGAFVLLVMMSNR